MATTDEKAFEFPSRAFALLVIPATIVPLSAALISAYGMPQGDLANAVVRNGHVEAAGRLRMLGAWFLLAAAAFGYLVYFFRIIAAFSRTARSQFLAAYLLFALGGTALVAFDCVQGADHYFDQRVICDALALSESSPPTQAERLADGPPCVGNAQFRTFQRVNEFQKYILALLIPAMALSVLACLALPSPRTEEACRLQVQRLNSRLYLTAAILVLGLIYLSALLHWPEFAFQDTARADYRAHVDAYVLYWGVTYSVLIGSYYIPIVFRIFGECQRLDTGKIVQETAPIFDPATMLKSAGALFAPAITGFIGSLVSL